MPTYSMQCSACGHKQEKILSIKAFDKESMPACDICQSKTEHFYGYVPQFSTKNLGEHNSFQSPYNGKSYQGHTSFIKHMAEHGAAPKSDYEGEAKHRREQIEKDEKAKRRKVIEDTVRNIGN